ncbi:MAG TPA: methyltransferase domain-containing protein [Caldilineae bacterium]|nr:methyltransferase domain-containing protein [Caldilineae bacterium]
MKQWYEELYEDFDAYDAEPYTQNTRAEVDFIEQVIGGDRSKAILDVGCGNGRHSLELARRGYQVLGVDLSASMLAQARQTAAAENLVVGFRQGDARALRFVRQFDVVIMLCEGAFSLMETDAMDSLILSKVFRALRPGGRLIMTAPNAAFMLAQPPTDAFDLTTLRETFTLDKATPAGSSKTLACSQRYYTCPELRWLLEQVGFRVIEFFACTERGYDRSEKPTRAQFELGVIAEK